jgi:hypothetical protein
MNLGARQADSLAVVEPPVRLLGMGHLPQHVITGMQQHRTVQPLAEFGGDGHMVVVSVGADDRGDVASGDRVDDDRLGLVRGVDDHDVGVVTDEPDVVIDIPGAAVPARKCPW